MKKITRMTFCTYDSAITMTSSIKKQNFRTSLCGQAVSNLMNKLHNSSYYHGDAITSSSRWFYNVKAKGTNRRLSPRPGLTGWKSEQTLTSQLHFLCAPLSFYSCFEAVIYSKWGWPRWRGFGVGCWRRINGYGFSFASLWLILWIKIWIYDVNPTQN